MREREFRRSGIIHRLFLCLALAEVSTVSGNHFGNLSITPLYVLIENVCHIRVDDIGQRGGTFFSEHIYLSHLADW